MKKIMIGVLIGFIAAGLLSLGTILLAQEKKSAETPVGELIVLGGLKIKEGVSAEDAEKALKEQLIPAMKNIEGLEMKILKKMKVPGQQPDSGAYDYIMMAEIGSVQVFMQLLAGGNPALEKFGDVMKTYAGHPYINPYIVIAETEESSDDDDEDDANIKDDDDDEDDDDGDEDDD